MNLRTLRYFVTIADVGSLTGAAATLGIAQPALTRRVRELESDFGVTLLLRRPRGVVLTPAGVTFYEAAKRILAEEARLRDRLARTTTFQSTSLVLGAPPTLTRLLLPGLLESCARQLDGVRLGTKEAFTPDLIEALERGSVDMAIVTNPPARAKLTFQPLVSEPFALISHLRMGLKPLVSIEEIAQLPIVMTSLHLRLAEEQVLILGKTLDIAMEIDSVDTIREMVSRGRWATIMPVSVFNDGHGTDRLVMSQIAGVQFSRQLTLATRVGPPQPPLVLVQDLLVAEIERLAAAGRFSFAA